MCRIRVSRRCGVTTDLLRRDGGVPAGRAVDHTPCSRWQTHTVIAAVRLEGLGARAVFDGPLICEFSGLCGASAGADAAAGRRRRARQSLVHQHPRFGGNHPRRRAAAVSPPDSPEFNPIELAFAKLKAFFGAARPRSLSKCAIFSPRRWPSSRPRNARAIRHCGYRVLRRNGNCCQNFELTAARIRQRWKGQNNARSSEVIGTKRIHRRPQHQQRQETAFE